MLARVSGSTRAKGTRTRALDSSDEREMVTRGRDWGRGIDVPHCNLVHSYGRGRRTASPHASTELERAEFEDDRVRCRKAAEDDRSMSMSMIMIMIASAPLATQAEY